MTTEQPVSWGPWTLDRTNYRITAVGYEIELLNLTSSAEVLDTICQVASKAWAGRNVVAGLVWALIDLLGPQAYLCSHGEDTPVTPEWIGERVRTYRRVHGNTSQIDDPLTMAIRANVADHVADLPRDPH